MIYGVTPFIESQKKIIQDICFGKCGKISMAAFDLEGYGSFYVCQVDDCKYEADKTSVMGQVFDGEDFCVRKLKED